MIYSKPKVVFKIIQKLMPRKCIVFLIPLFLLLVTTKVPCHLSTVVLMGENYIFHDSGLKQLHTP